MGDRRARPPPPRARPSHKPTGASLVVIIAVAAAFAGVMVLHLVRSDLNPLREVMSHYANGSRGWLMSVVFYAFGVSALALGFRMRTGIDRVGVTRPIPWLLLLSGVCMIAAGVFEVDRPLAPQTIQETIHSNSAVAAFVMLVVAMLLVSLACRSDDRWWNVRWGSLGLSLAAAVSAVATQFARGSTWSGSVQRVLAGSVLAWMILITLHLRSKAFRIP